LERFAFFSGADLDGHFLLQVSQQAQELIGRKAAEVTIEEMGYLCRFQVKHGGDVLLLHVLGF